MKIDRDYIERNSDSVFSSLDKLGANKDILREMKAIFESVRKAGLNEAALDYCVNTFVAVEIDFKTAGNRGLGRITDNVPRLGGYFRKQISNLSPEKKSVLADAVVDYIMAAYIGQSIYTARNKFDRELTAQNIYQKWIPNIYMFSLNTFKEAHVMMLQAATNDSIMALRKFLVENKMKGGTLFKSDKTEYILLGYATAGITLRQVEINYARLP